MIYAIYFVPREGRHPNFGLDIYPKLWPIMKSALSGLGHELVHITDLYSDNLGDSVFRVDVDPETTVYSRDVAWAEFVRQLPEGEQACMIEPDTYMMRDIPPIADDKDLVVLQRPEKCVPGWFRLAKKSAAPFYDAVVTAYEGIERKRRVFHGDITAVHSVLGIGDRAKSLPGEAANCKIEVRDWHLYGDRQYPNAFFHQYKGTSKNGMLRI